MTRVGAVWEDALHVQQSVCETARLSKHGAQRGRRPRPQRLPKGHTLREQGDEVVVAACRAALQLTEHILLVLEQRAVFGISEHLDYYLLT